MKGENLVKLILNTADTNINGYNENTHGQGMLDLDEATKPQGEVGVPTTGRVDGTITTLNNTLEEKVQDIFILRTELEKE